MTEAYGFTHQMSGFVELSSSSQASRSGPDYSHSLTRSLSRYFWIHPALSPGVVYDVILYVLDGHRVIVNTQNAGAL